MSQAGLNDPMWCETYRQQESDRLQRQQLSPEKFLLAEDAFRIAEHAIDERFGKNKPKKAVRMKHILRLYVLEERSLEEIGNEFDLSRERARQILCQARHIVRRTMQHMDGLEVSA